MEEWRSVVGYEGVYEISSLGRIRRIKAAKGATPGAMLKSWKRNGYPSVYLSHNSITRCCYVHRLLMEAFYGSKPDLEVNHKDGVRDNCVLDNLEYVSHSENVIHSFKYLGHRKNPAKGEAQGSAKLTEVQVSEIRRRYVRGATSYAKLGAEYGVDPSNIGIILKRKGWAHVG